ncbi:MAG TPA: hypothetical protein VMF90_03070 [Rhizobiaceae bacterium]|nr:hypothetical protein [Rhizobiaceae bacterium]
MAEADTFVADRNWRERLTAYVGSRDSLFAAFAIVIIPNLVFFLISPWFLIRRMLSPGIYLIAAILALVLPWGLTPIIFFLASALDVFFVVAFLFDMPIGDSIESLMYVSDIDVAASALYVSGIVYFVALPLILSVVFIKYRDRLRRASMLPALLLALGACWFDHTVNGFKPIAYPEFESAMSQNGLTSEAIIARDRDLLFVLVEGMGAYRHPEERAILEQRLRKAAEGRFTMKTGTSNYFGSTTGGTARELCGEWHTYTYYLAEDRLYDCLPQRLATAGYQTSSYHASYGALFSRPTWYPRIGIQKLNFREDIERENPSAIHGLCGSVFTGLCDADVGRLVHEDLRKDPGKRKLMYWLTLNTHQPHAPVVDGKLDCRGDHPVIPALLPCELTELWSEVFDVVAAIAADPTLPPLDIVVVGDHNTPMWLRKDFNHFINGKVDWYYLEDSRKAAASN